MTHHPTDAQRAVLESIQRPVTVVQFLAAQPATFAAYHTDWHKAVTGAGGSNRFDVLVDQVLAGGAMPYNRLLVDTLPSGMAVLQALDATAAAREAGCATVYALAVQPSGAPMLRLVRQLRGLAPWVSRLVGTTTERPLGSLAAADPATGPTAETVAVLRQADLTRPFYMMNLNRYYGRARYASGEAISGEAAYARYGNRIAPYLVSVGGYPALMGSVLGTVIGDQRAPIDDAWSEFAMVFYPSRAAFLRMLTHTPRRGLQHRSAGLQRAVLMPCSDDRPRGMPA